MSERQFDQESVQKEYPNPDDGSDCTFPDEIDLRKKKELLRWRYLEGGQRLPLYFPKVRHVDETEVFSSVNSDETRFMELATRLASDTRQIQREFVYTKQRADLLRREKELLQWHIASNSKVLKVKQSEMEMAGSQIKAIEAKSEAMMADADRLHRERGILSLQYDKYEKELEQLEDDYNTAEEEMRQWLARRGDYIEETTMERRKAAHERHLRLRQWRKLNRACNVDKKWHVKINSIKNADEMIYDVYDDVATKLAAEFDKAGEISGPIRSVLMEEDLGDPLEGFVSPTSKQQDQSI